MIAARQSPGENREPVKNLVVSEAKVAGRAPAASWCRDQSGARPRWFGWNSPIERTSARHHHFGAQVGHSGAARFWPDLAAPAKLGVAHRHAGKQGHRLARSLEIRSHTPGDLARRTLAPDYERRRTG